MLVDDHFGQFLHGGAWDYGPAHFDIYSTDKFPGFRHDLLYISQYTLCEYPSMGFNREESSTADPVESIMGQRYYCVLRLIAILNCRQTLYRRLYPNDPRQLHTRRVR